MIQIQDFTQCNGTVTCVVPYIYERVRPCTLMQKPILSSHLFSSYLCTVLPNIWAQPPFLPSWCVHLKIESPCDSRYFPSVGVFLLTPISTRAAILLPGQGTQQKAGWETASGRSGHAHRGQELLNSMFPAQQVELEEEGWAGGFRSSCKVGEWDGAKGLNFMCVRATRAEGKVRLRLCLQCQKKEGYFSQDNKFVLAIQL